VTDWWLSIAGLVVLTLTFAAIVWYSLETRWLRQETGRLRQETLRQTKLQIQPFVVLHWPGSAPVVGPEIQEWTPLQGALAGYRLAGLCAMNHGARPACAVEIQEVRLPAPNPKGWTALWFAPFDYLVPGQPVEVRVEAIGPDPGAEVEQPPLNALYRKTLDEIGCSDGVDVQVTFRDLLGIEYRMTYLIHPKGVRLRQPLWPDAGSGS